MSIVENIREIGLFIVAAQMLVHLAAGKSYEKYIKIIAGVTVLLLFLGPFVDDPGRMMDRWQEELERMEQQMDRYDSAQQNAAYAAGSPEAAALRQIEAEVKSMLSEAVTDDGCTVGDVEIVLEDAKEDGSLYQDGQSPAWELQRVRVTLQAVPSENGGEDRDTVREITPQTQGSAGSAPEEIRVERITLGSDAGGPEENDGDEGMTDTDPEEYGRIFAQMLGVAQDKVEVVYHGGR